MSHFQSSPIYLIDGSGYIFRAYYAIRNLSTSHGFPTNAIYGFTQMLWKLLKDAQPTHCAVVFDSKEPTFRETLYTEYKANRAEPPDDLIPQFPYFRKVVEAMCLPQFELPGFEADDIIGTIATRMAAAGHEVVIVTGDKDFMQLVGDRVRIIDTMKEKQIGIAEVRERFGVDPVHVVDVLGLAGDSTDNVPGIPGIGEKTAIKLVQQFGSLEAVLAHPEQVGGKLADRIRTHAADARLAKKLVTIHTAVPVPEGLQALAYPGPSIDALRALFKELEFTRLLQELAPQSNLNRTAYRCIRDVASLHALAKEIHAAGVCAVDTETTGLDPMRAELVGISIATAPGAAAYIPLLHHLQGLASPPPQAKPVEPPPHGTLPPKADPSSGGRGARWIDQNHPDVPTQLPLATVVEVLAPLFADATLRKYAQNAKFDLAILARHGLPIHGLVCDTMIASYVLNPAGAHGLDAMAQQFLDHTMIAFKSVMGTGKTAKKDFRAVAIAEATTYAAEDADATFRLAEKFLPMLHTEGLLPLFNEIEMPLTLVLLAMEMTGIKVDTQQLRGLKREFTDRLSRLEAEIYSAAGESFNINSTRQLGAILFGKLQLPGGRRTKTGYSTNAEVLEELAPQHALPRLILDYRTLAKLLSTYVDALMKLIHPLTGRIHTSFNQTVAETGRLSSSDPNLQNIPIRTEEGRRIRAAFVAERGQCLLSADYSQIELRLLAHMSGDPALCEAFARDEDVHAQTAASLFGVVAAQVTSAQRATGKTVNFAVVYGQTPYGLARGLGIGLDDAKAYIDHYFTQYEGVATYHTKVLEAARRHGSVETLAKRRRYFPDINSQNANVRANAERMAFNTIFQGSAADIIKMAMIRIDRELRAAGFQTKMLLQVHDELVFEVPEAELARVQSLVTNAMEQIVKLSVPLKVDIGTGPTWAVCG